MHAQMHLQYICSIFSPDHTVPICWQGKYVCFVHTNFAGTLCQHETARKIIAKLYIRMLFSKLVVKNVQNVPEVLTHVYGPKAKQSRPRATFSKWLCLVNNLFISSFLVVFSRFLKRFYSLFFSDARQGLFTRFLIEFHFGMKRRSTRVYMENVSLGSKRVWNLKWHAITTFQSGMKFQSGFRNENRNELIPEWVTSHSGIM